MTEEIQPEPVTPPAENPGLPSEFPWVKEGSDRVICTIYAYKDPITNRLRNISLFTQDLLKEMGLIEYPIESEWSIPGWTKMELYRDRSTRPDGNRGSVVHRPTLQYHLIRHHLIDLRLRGVDGTVTPITLPRDESGSLTREAFEIIGQLHPTVVDLLYTKFTDDAVLLSS